MQQRFEFHYRPEDLAELRRQTRRLRWPPQVQRGEPGGFPVGWAVFVVMVLLGIFVAWHATHRDAIPAPRVRHVRSALPLAADPWLPSATPFDRVCIAVAFAAGVVVVVGNVVRKRMRRRRGMASMLVTLELADEGMILTSGGNVRHLPSNFFDLVLDAPQTILLRIPVKRTWVVLPKRCIAAAADAVALAANLQARIDRAGGLPPLAVLPPPGAAE